MQNTLTEIQESLQSLQNPQKAVHAQRFFKTGKGEYGEGDVFLGLTVPQQRKISNLHYKSCKLSDIEHLLNSEIHEYRLTALFILVLKYQKEKDEKIRETYVDFYLCHTERVNNWDLVDSSAHYILGDWLYNKDKSILYKLSKSGHLWEERISMIACMFDIRKGVFDTALDIAKNLLHHEHDLIHKAVGWMLREIGKIDIEKEEAFLLQHYKNMPRTMLRYAIERFPEEKRQAYLKGKM